MRSVEPKDLISHRVFFIDFDKYNSFFHWENSRKSVEMLLERKLKLLILTKGHVVVAASQLLESPFAHNLLLNHPELLNSGAIVSSMKYGHNTTFDFLRTKREEQLRDLRNPYHTGLAEDIANLIDQEGMIVRWKSQVNSGWFKDRLVSDLNDPQSLLRIKLKNQNVLIPNDISNRIGENVNLSRGNVESITRTYSNRDLENILIPYSNFVYYLCGARMVKSEGVLPQENLVDFSIGDLLGSKTKLSDTEIFFKIFIDIVKAKTSTIFPTDFLDAITIEDAIELRNISIEKSFVKKYNAIQEKTKEAMNIHDREKFVLLVSELEQFESDLFIEFSKTLDQELPTRIREKKRRAMGKVLHSIASFIIPLYSPESYKDMIVSGLTIAGKDNIAKSIDKKVANGLRACESMLEKMKVLDRQILLDFIDEMKKKYASNMFGY